MTTAKKIDGVPRELLVRLCNFHATGWEDIEPEIIELRALLDAHAALGEIDLTPIRLAHAESVIEQQNNLIASLRAELVESYHVSAQPHGEPVAWLGSGVPFLKREDAIEYSSYKDKKVVALYAEPPEPVAAPLDYGSLDAVQRLAVCRGEQVVPLAADERISELERDKARLDALESNCWDVRFDNSPNGDAGDSSISIEIVGHWMGAPNVRVIGENYNENLRAAIDQAMTAPAYPPALPEYPEPEAIKDDGWHMHPCKQGHRDVGAAGGIASCYTCDEKIAAASTQEAFEQWNATHPAT